MSVSIITVFIFPEEEGTVLGAPRGVSLPATIPNALSALLVYMLPTDTGPAPAAATTPTAPTAPTVPTTRSMSFDAASLTARRWWR